jgi:hypothetical protein
MHRFTAIEPGWVTVADIRFFVFLFLRPFFISKHDKLPDILELVLFNLKSNNKRAHAYIAIISCLGYLFELIITLNGILELVQIKAKMYY